MQRKTKRMTFGQRVGSLILAISMLCGMLPATGGIFSAKAEDAPHDLYYNFIKSNTRAARDASTSPTFLEEKVTSYTVNTYGASGQNSIFIYSDPWKYNSVSYAEGKNGYMRYLSPAYGIGMYNGGAAASFKLDIQIPVSGYYQAEVITAIRENGGIANLFLEQEGKDRIDLGTINTLSKTVTWGASLPLEGMHYLEAGEYTFVVESTTAGALIILDALRLNVISPGIVPAPILVGEEREIALYSAGGNAVAVASDSITATAADSSVLEVVRVDKESGFATVRGLAAGETKLSITTTGEVPLSYDLPVQVITENQGAKTLTYDLKKMNAFAAGKNDAAIPFINTYNQIASGAPGESNPSSPSAPWKYYGWSMLGVNLANDALGNGYLRCLGGAHGLCMYHPGRLQLRIRVPVGGTFDLKMAAATNSATPIQMLIYPYNEETRVPGAVVYNKSMETTTGGYAEQILNGGEVELASGEYLVDLVQQTRGVVLSLRSIVLESVKSSLKVSGADQVSTVVGETQDAALTVTDYEDVQIPADKLTHTVSVADGSVAGAEIVTENDTLILRVTGKKKGETIAVIDLSDDSERSVRIKAPIYVASDTELSMSVDLPDKIQKGETLRIPVRTEAIRKGSNTGVTASISVKQSVTGLLSATVETGEQAGDATLVLRGEKAGNVAITVAASAEGESAQAKQAVMVYDPDAKSTQNYRFMILKKLPSDALVSTADNYLKMMPSSGEEIRPGEKTDPWCFAGVGAPSEEMKQSFKYYYDTYGSALEMGKGVWGAIKIRVPESGIYELVSQNALYCMAGIMRVYLAPADAGNPRDPKWAIGSKDCILEGKDNTKIVPTHQTKLRTMPVAAGDYIVTWEIIGKNSECTAADPRLYIGGFYMNAVEELPKVTMTVGEVPETKVDNVSETELTAVRADGETEDLYGADITITADQEGLCEAKVVSRDGKTFLCIEGKSVGSTTLHLSLKFGGEEVAACDVPVAITKRGTLTTVEAKMRGSSMNTIALRGLKPESNKKEIELHFFDEDGLEISAEKAEKYGTTVTYQSSAPQVASIDETGMITALSAGETVITATVEMNGATVRAELPITVTNGKAARSYYTEEKLEAARENVQLYSWARSQKDSAVSNAEHYVGKEETLWNLVTTQELPRSYHVGYRSDPNYIYCRYCGVNIVQKYGNAYPWICDPLKTPWKVQCPDCRRMFPSNDFGSFYQLGLDEHGNWRYELAKEKNAELVASGKEGYLKNILYPEKGEGWAVDDGYGYVTGNTYPDGCPEVHTYISYYNHWGIWHATGAIYSAVEALSLAYIFTGEAKYGRTGAILIDRIADVYPDMDTNPYRWQLQSTAAVNILDYVPQGKTVDLIWENQNATRWSLGYDAFFPAYEDPYVVNFLSEKAEKYQMQNPKTTTSAIRENCEDGILREVFRSAKNGKLNGNFGMTQSALAYAAVVLDTMPETRDMLDWNFRAGENVYQGHNITGGNIVTKIMTEVNRDGISSTEVSTGYSDIWTGGLSSIVDALAGYEGYAAMDFYNNPRYIKMLKAALPLIMGRRQTVAIGDSSGVADSTRYLRSQNYLKAFKLNKDPVMAQLLWFAYDGSLENVHYDIYTKNPNSAANDIREVIEEYGEYDFDQSSQLAGYGFTALRGGTTRKITGQVDPLDTQRDFWMFYGNNASHGHRDGLNLGMRAYGIDMAPELGYPIDTTSDNYYHWGQGTIAHNTVMVNDIWQEYDRTRVNEPLHYDGDGRVKLMDVDASDRYKPTSIYRRSLVMVDVDDDVSCGVDFFRVKGGNEHLYSFHSLSDEIVETENLSFTKQADQSGEYIGSYAGPTVAYGTTGITNGFSWLKNVDRADNIQSNDFMVDFKIKDFRNQFEAERDLHLRMTMLNSFTLSEVSVADGIPAQRNNNPESLKYVLARRSGSNLDSLFTTVFEPYDTERYIDSIEHVTQIQDENGADMSGDESVRAVKVTLKNGRVDYIVYAADNTKRYRIDDLFDFRGFVGIYMLSDGENVYSYLNDGDLLGDMTGEPAYSGTVVDFTKDLAFENKITLQFDQEIDPERLSGQFIYVDDQQNYNAAYELQDVERVNGNTVTASVGDVTFIYGMRDKTNLDAGYTYTLAEGDAFTLPLVTENNNTPVFQPIAKKTAEVGSELKFPVAATSPLGKELTYSAKTLPRGAQFDPESQTFSWIPDSGLLGKQYAAFEVTDGTLSATQYVEITVYNSASGGGTGSITNTPGSTSTEKPIEPKPPVVTVEEDEVSFAASAEETTAETKLGSVTFADGTFAADGQGKLKIERENETYTVSVTATVDMEQKPAKVSLNYTPADNMTDENCIIVKDANGNIIPNGRYENGKMTFYTESFGKFTIEYNPKNFTDLGNHAWASGAITRLAARGIINGITATTYGPERNITRADFTTLIVRAFGFTAETASFADVPANAYYAEPVGIAKTLGIVGGVNETEFAPTAEITRQDMMVIVARALEKAGYVLDASENPEFSDIDEVADYANDAVEILTKSGLIAGSNGKVNPKGKTTRAEVAVILDRIVFMAE